MKEFLIEFKKLEWETAYRGQRQKTYSKGTDQLRLVELTDEYHEEEWCEKEHIGYVLEGRIIIDFDEESITFNQGDGIFITGGKKNRHKGKIAKDEQVLILFFEKV